MNYKYPIIAELVNSLEQRRDAYITYWEQFRDACAGDDDMLRRVDTFFIDVIDSLDTEIMKLQTQFASF